MERICEKQAASGQKIGELNPRMMGRAFTGELVA